MFDHFPNMFGLLKLNSRRAELAKLKNQLFEKKKISDFPADVCMFERFYVPKWLYL